MSKTGAARHTWGTKWDEEEQNIVEVCGKCGIKRRKRILYNGGMLRTGTISEHFVNGVWQYENPDCKTANTTENGS
jgi:hypothetical protein